eukprot:43634-Rhodomonas_salina.3
MESSCPKMTRESSPSSSSLHGGWHSPIPNLSTGHSVASDHTAKRVRICSETRRTLQGVVPRRSIAQGWQHTPRGSCLDTAPPGRGSTALLSTRHRHPTSTPDIDTRHRQLAVCNTRAPALPFRGAVSPRAAGPRPRCAARRCSCRCACSLLDSSSHPHAQRCASSPRTRGGERTRTRRWEGGKGAWMTCEGALSACLVLRPPGPAHPVWRWSLGETLDFYTGFGSTPDSRHVWRRGVKHHFRTLCSVSTSRPTWFRRVRTALQISTDLHRREGRVPRAALEPALHQPFPVQHQPRQPVVVAHAGTKNRKNVPNHAVYQHGQVPGMVQQRRRLIALVSTGHGVGDMRRAVPEEVVEEAEHGQLGLHHYRGLLAHFKP